MLSQIHQLHAIATKPTRLIVGLMSGTSLDGLDIALCEISGASDSISFSLLKFKTQAYTLDIQTKIRAVFAQANVDMLALSLLNEYLGSLHGTWVAEALTEWNVDPDSVDLVASHGQTIFHAPKRFHQITDQPDATLQIGDGDHVARACGIITLSDFRQRHIAAGGEGAPLVVYGDQLLFSSASEARLLLNIGGIANFTYLPKQGSNDQAYCSDIGPGNTLMDAYCQKHFNQMFDEDGQVATRGKVIPSVLNALKEHEFFTQPFPKTTGPESFNLDYLHEVLTSTDSAFSHYDIMATLTQFSADTISDAITQTSATHIYVSGGGASNPLLMSLIQQQLPWMSVQKTDELGLNADAKEAALFAVLANECVAGDPSKQRSVLGMPMTSMGKICFPN